jgi:hypothetical protein
MHRPLQEYCDCGTLAAVASEWRLEPESDQKMLERLQLLLDCARGLKELHSRNVVHGDLVSHSTMHFLQQLHALVRSSYP